VLRAVGGGLLELLRGAGVPAFNAFAAQRLADDVAALRQLAAATDVPALAVRRAARRARAATPPATRPPPAHLPPTTGRAGGAQDELAEAATVCQLLVAGTLEDVLDAGKRAALGRLDLRRLAAILPKYRCGPAARCGCRAARACGGRAYPAGPRAAEALRPGGAP